MSSFTDIQQAFVHRYMNDEDVIGVRIRRLDGRIVLFVEVGDRNAVDLPETFRGLPVVVHAGRRAMLAYS
ncbi:MAG: hypothetical protein ACRDLF_06550 [Solirubrobacteraceae bacterium]